MGNIKALVIDGLLWCALCALLALGFANHGSLRQYSSVSLRYDAPISGQAAYAARQYSITRSDGDQFWPVFWKEYRASLESELAAVKTDCIAYSGDASLVWPAVYVSGNAPGMKDGAGCAISEALSWRLWGSSDVVGMTVEVDGDVRVVRGVFKGTDELALVPFEDEDTTQSWTAVELTGGPSDAVRSDAESYARAAGLGSPDSTLMRGPSSIAAAMSILPILVPATYGLALAIRLAAKRFPLARKPAFYLSFIMLAVLLPAILGLFPAWVVPTRWSDFQFWLSLLNRAADGLREFLRAAPKLRDVELRVLLIKQVAFSFFAVVCGLSICFRWHMNRGIRRDA